MYPDWYHIPKVIQAIRKYVYKREFCLLRPKNQSQKENVRTLRAHNTQAITYLLTEFKIFTGMEYNLYASVAQYQDGIPIQTMNLKKRNNDEWIQHHWKFIETYDFVLDIDNPKNIRDIGAITGFLTKLLVPFYVRFSGNGFHIIIPDHAFPAKPDYNPDSDESIYDKYRYLAYFFKDNFCKDVDDSIYDSRRVLKIPYTIAIYEKEQRLCAPILMLDFDGFKKENMIPENWMSFIGQDRLFNEGNCEELCEVARIKW